MFRIAIRLDTSKKLDHKKHKSCAQLNILVDNHKYVQNFKVKKTPT